jgi:hypothetical protein
MAPPVMGVGVALLPLSQAAKSPLNRTDSAARAVSFFKNDGFKTVIAPFTFWDARV